MASTGTFTEPRQFNLMFKTHAGPIEDAGAVAYLRPETAQGMFINFSNVLNSTRRKPPFGIAQVGKSFRNEITPQNWIFRTREFEQMEMEYFVPPADSAEVVRVLVQRADELVPRSRHPEGDAAPSCPRRRRAVALLDRHLRRRVPVPVGLGRGSKASPSAPTSTSTQHSNHSGEKLDYFDQATNERYKPYVIEPAVGVTRLFAIFLLAAYDEDVVNDETRTVLRLHPRLAPYKVAVLPLVEEGHADAVGAPGPQDAQRALHGRLRRDAGDRPALSPPGRDRYAAVRHHRLRFARRRRGDDPRSRHHRAGSCAVDTLLGEVRSRLGF